MIIKKNERRFFFLLILFLILSQLSFRWPVEEKLVTSTFGESRGDHFHDGMDLIGPKGDVYPIDSGRLLFFWDKNIFPFENYPGGGNYKVIKHNSNLTSIYMHLQDNLWPDQIYTPMKKLGSIGNTGHSFGPHLHFSILDLAQKVSINPFKILPDYEDKKEPQISNIYFRIKDNYIFIKNNSLLRLTQSYPLLVKIVDSAQRSERLGIYGLKIIFNGQPFSEVIFEKIDYTPQGLEVEKKSFSVLFDEDGFYKISGLKYLNGENILKVIASDYAGNRAEKIFTFNLKLDTDL